jgi:hypothetical protein
VSLKPAVSHRRLLEAIESVIPSRRAPWRARSWPGASSSWIGLYALGVPAGDEALV